jgi:hypothetical protein
MFSSLDGVEVVVFDFDGTAQDEVTHALDRVPLRGGTRLSNAFREFIVVSATALARSRAARQIAKTLDPEAVKLMRELVKKGVLVMIRTSNATVDTVEIRRRLEEVGLFNVLIERVRNSEKGNDVNGVRPLVIDDDPTAALWAAKKGCKVFLLAKTYNRIRGALLRISEQNPITTVKGMAEAGEKINAMPLSCNISMGRKMYATA